MRSIKKNRSKPRNTTVVIPDTEDANKIRLASLPPAVETDVSLYTAAYRGKLLIFSVKNH